MDSGKAYEVLFMISWRRICISCTDKAFIAAFSWSVMLYFLLLVVLRCFY